MLLSWKMNHLVVLLLMLWMLETIGKLDASGSLVYSLTWITETFVSVFSFEGVVFSFVGCKLKGFTRSCRECVLMVFGPNFFLIDILYQSQHLLHRFFQFEYYIVLNFLKFLWKPRRNFVISKRKSTPSRVDTIGYDLQALHPIGYTFSAFSLLMDVVILVY